MEGDDRAKNHQEATEVEQERDTNGGHRTQQKAAESCNVSQAGDESSSSATPSSTTLPDDVPDRLNPHKRLKGGVGTVSKLQDALQLRHIAMCDVYTGLCFSTPWGRLFGGEILAQAVMAACATVPDTHPVHSLHGYFILAGQNGVPVMFSVERTRTGKSFMTRTVNAKQENRSIFTLMISFHRKERGMRFEIPLKEKRMLVRYRQLGLAGVGRDVMPRPAQLIAAGRSPTWDHTGSTLFLRVGFGSRWNFCWIKHARPIQSTRSAVHCAILAFMSDFGLIRVIKQPHEFQAAEEAGMDMSKFDPSEFEMGLVNWSMSMSLDHSIHFHHPELLRADEWMLVCAETMVSAGARGLAHATVFSHDTFTLLASFQQEGLVRVQLDEERARL